MASRHHRNRFFDRIDVGEFNRDFAYARQAFVNGIGAQVIELKQHVIFFRPDTAAFFDFLIHRARHHIAASEIFHIGRITLHEALAAAVD